ncbi:hypothetical protein PDIDSM_8506 [Penicillium digitatum]|nr:hypothetical protein PDIDSM_8506 [Penicillium digitatum]
MASKGPWPACVEDYDEEHHAILPDTRLSANIAANTAAKLSTRLERFQEPLIDGASDSGYSSRTAATVNSTQSGPSGGKGPTTPLKLDTPRRNDLARKSSTRERKDKERSRPSREEKMVGAYPGAAHHAHVPRSSSKSRQRESSHAGPYHDNYYDYPTQYHQSNPGDHRQSEYSYYQSRPPVPEYSSSSHHAHYPAVVENIHASHSGRPSRSNSYHTYHPNGRPMSFHGVPHGMGSGMASPMYPQHGYDHHGPPPASSAYMHQYSSSSYGQTPSYYAPSASDYPPSEYPRERSRSREPSRHRSSSVYTAPIPPVDSASYPWFDEEPPMEHYSSRDVRERPPTRHQEQDEDYYRMPHPGAKPSPGRRFTRRSGQSGQSHPGKCIPLPVFPPNVAHPEAWTEIWTAWTCRNLEPPCRLRDRRRSTSYQDDRRTAQVAVASSRRRKPIDFSDDEQSSSGGDLEDLEREAENYQAARSGRAASAALPPSADALLPAKASHRNGSESGSQNSRSSRDSATPSRKEEDKNMTLTLNGFQIGFTSEAVTGKSINILTEETGGVRLNIGGPRVPKQHVNSTSSNYAGGSSRRELEDVVRRPRDDRRSERSRR